MVLIPTLSRETVGSECVPVAARGLFESEGLGVCVASKEVRVCVASREDLRGPPHLWLSSERLDAEVCEEGEPVPLPPAPAAPSAPEAETSTTKAVFLGSCHDRPLVLCLSVSGRLLCFWELNLYIHVI